MNTLVLYKSKSGYTKTYAEWIAESLNCDIKEGSKLSIDDVKPYDMIIYGGGMYAGTVNGLNFIKNNFKFLKDKKIVLWATGGNAGREDEMLKVWQNYFSDEQLQYIEIFYLRGGLDISKLNFPNKIIMNGLKFVLKRSKNPSDDVKGLLSSFDVPQDFRDKKNIVPLVQYVSNLQNN